MQHKINETKINETFSTLVKSDARTCKQKTKQEFYDHVSDDMLPVCEYF